MNFAISNLATPLLISSLTAVSLGWLSTSLITRGSPSRFIGRRPRKIDQSGEGVISAAIAVLIIASLGALMWVGFKSLWENAESTTNSEISKIGQ